MGETGERMLGKFYRKEIQSTNIIELQGVGTRPIGWSAYGLSHVKKRFIMAQAKADKLIDSTIEALDGGADSVKPKDGASLIKDWISALKNEESLSTVADELQDLHDELTGKEPDPKKISTLLKKLGDQTAKAAKDVDGDQQDSLKNLAESLKEFSKELK